jgi:hypothetical protein
MVEKSNTDFGKKLASADKKTRDNALKKLSKFLSHKKDITELELLKLWKGLFYCYWMSDKQLIQQQLANQLGTLLLKIPNDVVFNFLRAFWKIIIQEWNGIDRLRIDRYYFLMRRIHYYTFKFLEKVNWRKRYVSEYVNLYDIGPLSFLNDKTPHEIHYHICKVFFEIFEEAIKKPIPKKAFQKLLEPFIDIVTFSFDYVLIEHASSEIFLHLYKQLKQDYNGVISDDDDDEYIDDDEYVDVEEEEDDDENDDESENEKFNKSENMDEDSNNNNNNNSDKNLLKEKSIYFKSVDVPELYCKLIDLTEEPTTNPSNIEVLNYISELFYSMASKKLENGDNTSESDDDEFNKINAEYDEPDIILTGYENKENIINKPSILKVKKTVINNDKNRKDSEGVSKILKRVKDKKIKNNKSNKKNFHWNLKKNKIKLFDKNDNIIYLIK